MTKASEIKYKYLGELEKAGIERAEAIAELEIVFGKICDCTTKDILLDFDLSKKDKEKIDDILKQRISTRRPIQQLLGVADFYGKEFLVNESTLIPRPETEILVNEAIGILKNLENPKVLDIGTGTGNIACCIADEVEEAEVIGVDISSSALQVALRNAQELGVIKKAMFRKSDIFSNVSEKFDMIVSNPPYIPRKDKETLQKEVRDFEPERALFTDDDEGLDFYRSIISDAAKYLNLEGYLLFEVGAGQAEAVEDLLVQNYFRVIEVKKDFAGIDRVVVAQID